MAATARGPIEQLPSGSFRVHERGNRLGRRLRAAVDLNTVAGRLGHAEGSTTLKLYAQFAATANQRAAVIIPSQLDTPLIALVSGQ